MKLSPDEVMTLKQDYESGCTRKELTAKYGISSTSIMNYVHKYGFKPRYKISSSKTCPSCRRKIAIHDARFCPYCAADVRSCAERAAERLESLFELSVLLPESARNDFSEGVREAIAALKEDKQ
nr:MAG TPA: zinc-ribbon containing domain protein [Caudoviricetes sp.]